MHPTNTLLHLSKPDRTLQGAVTLDGSKSLSNRALIIMALGGAPDGQLSLLSTSNDTRTLQRLLSQSGDTFDAGDAGTVFRFMTAYLALQPGTQVLTGSPRMLERPVGGLALALRELGADIEFLGREGYPPLRIGPPDQLRGGTVHIDAGVSSQFLSALLMVAPYLPGGLVLAPEGPLVSRPYLEMTVRLMQYFGAAVAWEGDRLRVEEGRYTPRPLTIEADWSAASYWYALAAFADQPDLTLRGLFRESLQGDAVLARMMEQFGLHTEYLPDGVHITRSGEPKPIFEWDFLECPDIAQTLAVVCAGLGTQGIFSGLETLSIKETDRISALRDELRKVDVSFSKLPAKFSKAHPDKTFYLVDGRATWTTPPRFATYGDHRMAMSFAPLVMFAPVVIESPEVVRKSYPTFWEHLGGFGVQY
jgi:3-phosphoshikimate 1-carboxyvinyltransferase